MSQFNYLNEVNSIFKMDGELTVNCPAPRWQKKLENSNTSMLNTSKLSMSYNNSYTAMAASLSGKTPQKQGKSPGIHSSVLSCGKLHFFLTKSTIPGRKTTPNAVKTPSGGDRFIPNRSTTNFDLGHYKVSLNFHSSFLPPISVSNSKK